MDYTKVISTVKKYAIAIVDELGGALDGIATKLETFYQAIKQETNAIKTDVAGVKTDVGGVKTDVAGVKSDVAGVKSDVAGVRGGVDTTLQGVTELLSKGTVKSVQRGVVQWKTSDGVYGKEVTVNFAQVNPSKTIVILQASNNALDGRSRHVAQASLASLSATSMQLNVSVLYNADPYLSNNSIYASWQVIEFY